MSKRVVSKEEKMRDIAEARELYIEAGKLIAKANKLIKKNVRDLEVIGASSICEYRPLEKKDVVSKEYVGLVPVHLYSGITRLEKAVGINSKAALDYMERKRRGERALIVEGIVFTQTGDATLEKHTYR